MSELRKAAFVGARWFAGARAIAEVVAFGSSLVQARLIPPPEFGRAVVAMAFFAVGTTLFTEGVAAPLVQRRDASTRHFEVGAVLSVVSGLVLAALFAFVVPLAVSPVFGERTAELVRLLAPVFVFNGIAAVPRAMLQRRLDFRTLGAFEVLSLLAGSAATLALAFAGLDGEAIIAGLITRALAEGVLLFLAARPPLPRWRRGVARDLVRFGGTSASASVIFNLWRNADYAIVGARLGAQDAGLFWRAYTLAFEYPGKVSSIMSRMALPLFSRADDLDHLKRIRVRVVRVHATALFPFLAALAVLAPTLIPLLYGPGWEGAIVPAQLLALAGLTAVVSTGVGPLLVAVGRPGVVLALNTGNFLAYAGIVFLVAPQGLTAVAIGALVFFTLSFIAVQLVVERVVGIPLRSVLAEIAPGAVASAAFAIVGYPLARVLEAADAPPVLVLVAVGAVGGLVYLGVLRSAFRTAWDDLALLAAEMLRRRPRVAS